MSIKRHGELPAEDVMRLTRTRADQLLNCVSPRISTGARSLLVRELESVFRVFEENLPVLRRGCGDHDIISPSEAAALLFVSRTQVLKLISERKLPLADVAGQTAFLRKSDVMDYKAKKIALARAFFESQTEDTGPLGL